VKALLVTLLIPFGAFAQVHRPAGFVDIPWRAKSDEVLRLMLAKPGMARMGGNTGPSRLEFKGGSFAGKPALFWGLEFVDGGLYRGAVVLKSFGERSRDFEAAKALIASKYGPSTTTSKKDRDSKAIWRFPATATSKDAEIIIVWNHPGGDGVKITYRNESMKAGEATDRDEL